MKTILIVAVVLFVAYVLLGSLVGWAIDRDPYLGSPSSDWQWVNPFQAPPVFWALYILAVIVVSLALRPSRA